MAYIDGLNTVEKKLCVKATQMNVPINGILELTPLCNMNCDMCFVRLDSEELNNRGKLRTVDEWLKLADEMKNTGVLFILITGGEPLLYPGFKELYLKLRKLGMIITINSNGTLINEEWARFFSENKPRRINITLYGANSETYSRLCKYSDGYEKTINGIKLLKEYGVDVKINGSIAQQNKKDGKKIVQVANKLKIYSKIDTYMYPANRERYKPFSEQARLDPYEAAKKRVELMKEKYNQDDYLQNINNFLKKYNESIPTDYHPNRTISCRAGTSSFCINWQGIMRPCVMLTQPSAPVFEIGFNEAWKQINQHVKKIKMNSKCSQCKYQNVCQTCAACAKLESGSFDGIPEYMCIYTKETVRLLQEEYEKIMENKYEENI